jgi:hypothetical protein
MFCIKLMLEECSLRVLGNSILRRIFKPKRDENGEWRSSTMRNFIAKYYLIVSVISHYKNLPIKISCI